MDSLGERVAREWFGPDPERDPDYAGLVDTINRLAAEPAPAKEIDLMVELKKSLAEAAPAPDKLPPNEPSTLKRLKNGKWVTWDQPAPAPGEDARKVAEEIVCFIDDDTGDMLSGWAEFGDALARRDGTEPPLDTMMRKAARLIARYGDRRAAEEREACAALPVPLDLDDYPPEFVDGWDSALHQKAVAIRARAEPEGTTE